MRRCVIIGGAGIDHYDDVRQYLLTEDFYIFCDCGLKHKSGIGVEPDLIVGDFDSWNRPRMERTFVVSEEAALSEHLKAEVKSLGKSFCNPETAEDVSAAELIILPRKKDDTDTVFAAKEGLRRGFEEFLFLGVTGQRMDHTLANVYTLLMLEEQGKQAMIVDDYSEMTIVGTEPVPIDDRFSYFSLISLSGDARHVNIKDALFPLSDGEIRCNYQYAVSNEVLPGKTAYVSAGEGKLLLIRIRRSVISV